MSQQTKLLSRKITALTDENNISGIIETLQESIAQISNNEINFLITKSMVNLDRKRVNIDIITSIITNVASNNRISIDSVTYTSYMDILNRRGKYEETLRIFDNIKVIIIHSLLLTHSLISLLFKGQRNNVFHVSSSCCRSLSTMEILNRFIRNSIHYAQE